MADFYCYVVNGVIERYNITKPKAHGNKAYGDNVTDAELAADGYFSLIGEAPAYDSATERLEGPVYTVGNGVVTRSYQVVPYVPPVPQIVTMRQARLALLGAGLLDDVEAAINAMADPIKKQSARIEWDYSSEVHRNKELVGMLAPALGLTDAQLDALFIEAAKL